MRKSNQSDAGWRGVSRLFLFAEHLTIIMIATLLLFSLFSTSLFAGGLYSYINEKGILVFTNIGVRSPSPASHTPSVASDRTLPKYASLIRKVATRHGLDENLVRAVVEVESNYNPTAVSRKGCIGLMQLHPDTAKRFGVRNSFDPDENIEGGVKYLKFLMSEFEGELPLVLAAYNAGENAVARYDGIPPYRETQNYVRKVTARYRSLGGRSARQSPPRLQRIVLPDGKILFTNQSSSLTGSD